MLPLYIFIDSSKIETVIFRLVDHARAIGDYINAMFFATYIIRVAHELIPKDKTHLLNIVKDFYFYMR